MWGSSGDGVGRFLSRPGVGPSESLGDEGRPAEGVAALEQALTRCPTGRFLADETPDEITAFRNAQGTAVTRRAVRHDVETGPTAG
ncbi:hypothetical protein J4H86_14480 [Spiractinospora alimapuensis]|uniref:hypothetical protein n=1 Tax=Spiractinospora alimapuensis TaxID=2820884 RepID=UPI001F28AE98|nr:hypothetical protein [Spiractinospora alimapuensis]QVQ50164.1 hypothetical protein J4H86_14480 [Spiractinospora alimapuensis]